MGESRAKEGVIVQGDFQEVRSGDFLRLPQMLSREGTCVKRLQGMIQRRNFPRGSQGDEQISIEAL